MMEVLLLALVAAISGTITMSRIISLKTMLKHHFIADVSFTIGLLMLFGGTLTGSLIVATAGLMFSLLLFTLRGLQKIKNRPPLPHQKGTRVLWDA